MKTLEAVSEKLSGVVGDLMVDQVRRVHCDVSVAMVAGMMAEHDLRRVVVVDYHDRVVGVVSQRDVLKHYLLFEDRENLEADDPHQTKVGTLITRDNPITVPAKLPLAQAAVVLATNKIGCLPVVDADNQSIGLLSITDLLRHIAGRTSKSLEGSFEFFTPDTENGMKVPAFIRRVNGDLVIPLASLNDPEIVSQYANMGYDAITGRILVKFTSDKKNSATAIKVKTSKENVVLRASDFVNHYKLAGKASAFDISNPEGGQYLVLTPRQSN